jgi:hypothetical protein
LRAKSSISFGEFSGESVTITDIAPITFVASIPFNFNSPNISGIVYIYKIIDSPNYSFYYGYVNATVNSTLNSTITLVITVPQIIGRMNHKSPTVPLYYKNKGNDAADSNAAAYLVFDNQAVRLTVTPNILLILLHVELMQLKNIICV